MKKNNIYILFSLFGVAVVLWQLLASGYVLTLDMVFGPHINLTISEGSLINTILVKYIVAFLTFVFNGWIAQKIILVTIFFLLFYFPLHFFKKIFNIENTYGAEYITSLVFTVNPFVYERFLAGHWTLILGYALLMPFIAYLIEFCKEWNYKNGLKLLGLIVLIGAISTHIFVISLIVTGLVFIGNFAILKFDFRFLKKGLLLCLAVLICSSYWLIPAILSQAAPIAIFGREHWEAFKTAGNGNFGTVINVLSLHGFWGEHENWIKRFLLPKGGGWIFLTAIVSLFSIIIAGICAGLKDKKLRFIVSFIIFFMFLAIIFSCGIGEGIFRNFNMWMLEHISFWRGFRDSQKWSVLIALSCALFAGLGARTIISWFQNLKYKKTAFYILLTVPILYTPMMLFGMTGQLQTIEYPKGWNEVNNILKEDKNCRALFLPWHQYYSLKFNNDILTANPSQIYFDCNIVSGKNTEIGNIKSQGENGEEYDLIEKTITDNNANPNETIELLKQKGIKYIIFTNDLIKEDSYKYPFLDAKFINVIINKSDIYLYKLY